MQFLLIVLIFTTLDTLANNLKVAADGYSNEQFILWKNEAEQSLKKNIHGSCQQTKVTDIIVSNDQDKVNLQSNLQISHHFPSLDEYKFYTEKPTTISKGNEKLIDILNGTRIKRWAAETIERWMVHPDHPGQDRKLCMNLTRTLGLGYVSNTFYDRYASIIRTSYLIHGQNALIDHSGAVLFACGYYQGEEGWETRWNYPKEWTTECTKHMKATNTTFDNMLIKITDPTQVDTLKACGFDRTAAAHYKKVLIISASLDSNFHHLTADSLSRIPRYLPLLRSDPEIMVHVRTWETFEKPQHRKTEKEQLIAKKSREMMLELLGINSTRLVTRSVVADQVFIPRAMAWSDALKNPAEIRLLATKLIKNAHVEVAKRRTEGTYLSKIDFSNISAMFTNDGGKILYHQADNTEYPLQPVKKNLIVLIRKVRSWGSRSWSDDVNKEILILLQTKFPDHHVLPHFSDAINSKRFCMACEIEEVTRADIIVGIHGAGLTKQMYMPPGGLVFELSPHINAAQMPLCGYYGNWAYMFGHHHYFYGYNLDNDGYGSFDGIKEDVNVVDVVTKAREYYEYLQSSSSQPFRAPYHLREKTEH